MISRGESLQVYIWEKYPAVKNVSLMTYIMLKKNITPLKVREKSSYPNKSPIAPSFHKSQMVSHIGGGGRSGFNTIKKMAGAHSSCGGFPD